MKNNSNITNYPHLASLLYNTPLMLHPDKAEIIAQVFQNHMKGKSAKSINIEEKEIPEQYCALEIKEGFTSEKPYSLTVKNTAIIPVIGTLVQRGSSLDAMSGLMSYQVLNNRIQHAKENSSVKGIVLEVDSGGGSVAGCFELCEAIIEARKVKPVWSIANEGMFSAAYAIGGSANRITAPKTANLGSIGAIILHVDQSKLDKTIGVKYTAIHAGKHKNDFSSHKPLSNDAQARMQSLVDRSYNVFVAQVAAGRGMDEQAVRDTEAQIYTIQEAIELGLADEIATLDETVEALESTYKSTKTFLSTRQARTTTKGNSKMNPIVLSIAAGTSAETINAIEAALIEANIDATIETQTSLTAEHVLENHASIANEIKQLGATAELDRIKAVHSKSMKGHEKLITNLMFDGKTTGDQAASAVLDAEKAAVNKTQADLDTDAAATADVTAAAAGEEQSNTQEQDGAFSEEKAEAAWEASKALQAEFKKKEHYVACAKAEHNKTVKVLGSNKK